MCIAMNAVRLLTSIILLSNSIPVFAAAKDADARPARIKFHTERGVQRSPFELRLSTDAADAQIFFTTNGVLPSPQTGQQWTNAVTIAITTLLRAAGYRGGKRVTEVETHTFLFLADVRKQTGGGGARNSDKLLSGDDLAWGDYRRDAHPYKTGPYELYTRDNHWRPEIQRLLTGYFPKRPGVFLNQLHDAGLYPQ